MSWVFIKIFYPIEFVSKLYTLLLAGCLTYLILIHFKNIHPRQRVHRDLMAVSENTVLGGGILWNDLWKMSTSITGHLPCLKDISPRLSKLLCIEFYAAVFHHHLCFKKLLTNVRSMNSIQPDLDTEIVYFFKWKMILATGDHSPQEPFTASDTLIFKELF